jgi:hypothetical protein
MSNRKPNVVAGMSGPKWAQSDSAFARFEGPLRLVRPTHRDTAKNRRDAADVNGVSRIASGTHQRSFAGLGGRRKSVSD